VNHRPGLPGRPLPPWHNQDVAALTEQRVTIDALARLAETLESFDVGPPGSPPTSDRDRLVGTIRSYLMPRAVDPELPMMVVVAGPSGSGKSTVVNSLSGMDASQTGSIRPTTRKPVVLAAPRTIADYQVIGGVECDTSAGVAQIFERMILVDTPDIDSTSTRHRAMAEVLIDNADVVVFVTSALRYADDVPWQILRRAQSRGAPVIHVLNRVGSGSAGSALDFRSKLAAAGMSEEVILISEHFVAEGSHRVPPVAVEALGNRLNELAAHRELFASEIFRQVLSAILAQVIELADNAGNTRDAIDDFEARLVERLVAHVSGLNLAPMTEALVATAPTGRSRRAIRRWMKSSATPTAEVRTARNKLTDRIVSALAADVRSWLVEEQATLRGWEIASIPVIDGMKVVARSAVEAWVDYVSRIAADFDASEPWLGQAVLIDAAIGAESDLAVEAIFSESGSVLVERARRELEGRLDVVYRHVARLLADAVRERHGEPDELELRASVGAVTASLAPINA
jgi:hypothetical protein